MQDKIFIKGARENNLKINRYKIEGLHNQFSFEGKLDENVNILVGNNGSFKSTLLYILYYMLQSKKIHGVYNIKHASIHFDENEDFIVYRSFEGTIADIQEKDEQTNLAEQYFYKICKNRKGYEQIAENSAKMLLLSLNNSTYTKYS